MSGSVFGNQFKIMTWGESHGKGVGVTIDGCPAGLPLCEEDIQQMLDRRKPGQSRFSTPRKEEDLVEIMSGTFEGATTGTPIALMVYNKTQRSKDYSEIASYYRPGHADYTFDAKYGFRDYRGGGRSSGRETIARVAAGAVAKKILAELGVTVRAYTEAIGPVTIDTERPDFSVINENPLYMPDASAAQKASDYLEECMKSCDSSGGIIACTIDGLPAGIGETVFGKIDARLSCAVLSVGAVKGFEIGDGFRAARSKGSENNDAFRMDHGKVVKKTNHSGGVLGGMSDGSQIFFRAAVKATPSIASMQETVSKSGEEIEVSIHGRHDPVIVPRAVVVVESMAAITILDAMLENMSARMDKIRQFYRED